MNISDFFVNVKEKFSKIADTIVFWMKENKKLTIIIVSLLSIILICIILLVGISTEKTKSEKVYGQELKLAHEIEIPNGPELPRDYTLSRQPKEAWSEEEVERWFSTPSETDLRGLSKANDNIVDNLLGGTP